MSFAFDPEVETFREEVRDLIAKEFDPIIPLQGSFPQMDTPEKRVFVKKLAARGWLGLAWPSEYGGQDRSPLYQLVLQEELEYVRLPSMSIEVGMVGQTLLHHGSEALKAEFLPRIAAGEVNVALGYSEPQAGSDLASLQLRAVADGDEYVLNGQKLWTSGAHFADVIWLAARTNPSGPKHKGISLFLVDNNLPGMEIHPIETMGEHRTNTVFFSDVRVPASRLVGEVDRGWGYIVEALDYERVLGFPFGGLQRDIDELVAWARSDDAWQDADVRRLVAQLSVRVDGARSHLLRCIDQLGRGEVPTVDAAMLKVSMTESRQAIADALIDALGSRGLLRSGDPGAVMSGRFEENWRNEIITTIAGGANEIQRNIIARRHLQLPDS